MSLKTNNIKTILDRGQTAVGSFIFTREPICAEILGYAGFDFLLIDTEHTPNTSTEVVNLVRAAQISGAEPVVRVRDNDPALILQALDVGAKGIIVPHVNSEQEAKAVVCAAKYSPAGKRGLAGIVRAAEYGFMSCEEYIAAANKNTFIMVQVEDVEAVDNLDGILSVEGIDGIFIGPMDLSQSMGITGQYEHPQFYNTVLAVISRSRKAGKHVAIFCANTEDAKRWEKVGANVLTIASDTMFLAQAAKNMLQEIGR